MNCEPVLAHIGALGEPRTHHPPADRALQSAEGEETGKLPAESAIDDAARPEHGKGNDESNADQPAEHPVPPLPPIDELEPGERHVRIDREELGNLAVLVEFDQPVGRGQRRDDPVIGRHSVMERPDPVSRVAPPTMTVAATIAATIQSQMRTGRIVSSLTPLCGIIPRNSPFPAGAQEI